MASTSASVMKEFFRLIRDVDKLTDGQVKIMDLPIYGEEDDKDDTQNESEHEDRKLRFQFTIRPNDGFYKGASCLFQADVNSGYPEVPPSVTCLNKIYHPNIDYLDNWESPTPVCVNLLSSDWEPGVGLDGCIMAILFLFYHPALDDALSPAFSGNYDIDLEEYAENVKISIRGEEVDSFLFDRLIDDDDEEDDDDKEVDENDKGASNDNDTNVNEQKQEADGVDPANQNCNVSEEVDGENDLESNQNCNISDEVDGKNDLEAGESDMSSRKEVETLDENTILIEQEIDEERVEAKYQNGDCEKLEEGGKIVDETDKGESVVEINKIAFNDEEGEMNQGDAVNSNDVIVEKQRNNNLISCPNRGPTLSMHIKIKLNVFSRFFKWVNRRRSTGGVGSTSL